MRIIVFKPLKAWKVSGSLMVACCPLKESETDSSDKGYKDNDFDRNHHLDCICSLTSWCFFWWEIPSLEWPYCHTNSEDVVLSANAALQLA